MKGCCSNYHCGGSAQTGTASIEVGGDIVWSAVGALGKSSETSRLSRLCLKDVLHPLPRPRPAGNDV